MFSSQLCVFLSMFFALRGEKGQDLYILVQLTIGLVVNDRKWLKLVVTMIKMSNHEGKRLCCSGYEAVIQATLVTYLCFTKPSPINQTQVF